MFYYVDGYNLLFFLQEIPHSLTSQREHLIRFLQKKFSTRRLKGMLVFDGKHRKDEESGLAYQSPLVIAYAPKGQSADAYILEKIEGEKNRRQIIVVTNDRGLTLQARSLGANTLENEAFFNFLQKKKKKEAKIPKETAYNLARLLKIFEEELND